MCMSETGLHSPVPKMSARSHRLTKKENPSPSNAQPDVYATRQVCRSAEKTAGKKTTRDKKKCWLHLCKLETCTYISLAAIYELRAITKILVAGWKHAGCLCYLMGARWFLRFLGPKLELPSMSAYSSNIMIPTNEPWHAFWCKLNILLSLYYQVDILSELSGWRLVTMNAVYLWRYFPDKKYGSVDYKWYRLIKVIKKERLERFNRFNDQNTRRDSLYRYIISSWVGAPFNIQNRISFYAKDLSCAQLMEWLTAVVATMFLSVLLGDDCIQFRSANHVLPRADGSWNQLEQRSRYWHI